MRKLSFIVVLFVQHVVAQQMSVGDVKQKARCAVVGVQGNVTVNCSAGVPRSTVALLNQQFSARLKDRDVRITELTSEVNDWKDRFDKLIARLETPGMDLALRSKADGLILSRKMITRRRSRS